MLLNPVLGVQESESEPVTKEEYEEALAIAETVYNWVCNIKEVNNS